MSFDGIHDPLTPSGPHIASSSKFLTSSWVVLLKCRHIIFVTVGLLVILAVFFDSVIDVTLYKFFQSLLKIKLLGSLLQKDFVHNRSLGLLSVVFVLFLFWIIVKMSEPQRIKRDCAVCWGQNVPWSFGVSHKLCDLEKVSCLLWVSIVSSMIFG